MPSRSLPVHVARALLRWAGFSPPWIELPAGAVIVAPNHLSLIDGPLVACLTDRPMLFAVDPEWCCRQPWRAGLALLCWLGFGAIVPLDPRKPFAWRRLVTALRAGQAVCVFPQGGIAREDRPLPLQPGVTKLARLASAPIVPLRLHGTHRLLHGRRPGGERPGVSVQPAVAAGEPLLEQRLAEALRLR